MHDTSTTTRVRNCLARLNAGDAVARDELLNEALGRLRRLARKMLRDWPKVRRLEETDDLLQLAALRLFHSLESVKLTGPSHFFALAATQIRRELHDLARKHNGPAGVGKLMDLDQPIENRDPAAKHLGPRSLAEWAEFHQAVERLPDAPRSVFSLRWYAGLTFPEIGELLATSDRTVQRRWRDACVWMHERFGGGLPVEGTGDEG